MSSTAAHNPQITLNGAPHPLGAIAQVSDLVATLGLDPKQVAVELNRTIVPRSHYTATPIRTGDQVEIVSFIGGG